MTEGNTKISTGAGIRRVVTGHDAAGKAVVISDGITPNVRTVLERPGFSWNEVWVTSSMPARNDETGEPTDGPRTITPPSHGTKCRIIEFPPEADLVGGHDPNASDPVYTDSPHTVHVKSTRHPHMHRTETIDYAIVISGEITMLLDDSDVVLKAGDVVVQRGTNHAWSNRSNAPCRIAFVLIDAVPLA